MANTNYITSIVKILETPKQKLINDKILITEFRAFLPQIKKNKIVNRFILCCFLALPTTALGLMTWQNFSTTVQ